jgi:DNA-directed RNA polymerase alpha subunit
MTSYYPNPNLLDGISIDQVRLLPSIKRALVAAGLETVGDVRQTSDAMLLSFQNLGRSSVTRLRNELGEVRRSP